MCTLKKIQHEALDEAWIRLILEAKQLGLTKEAVRAFIMDKKAKPEKIE
ncbi:DNA-binding anti-repressor SinI [Cytobacillus sp.]|nr:DNA-binding anti-repressor SinI [Cytobacillus sp.]